MLDHRLDTFLAVCQTMSYTQAAQQLHLTQPAVSQHIRYLEEAYGVALFTYAHKKLQLTPAGNLLLQAVTTMRHDTLFLRERMQALEQPQRSLRFGATLTIGEFVLATPLALYCKKHPEVHLQLQVGNTQTLLEQINQGELDFALVEGYYDRSEFDALIYSTQDFLPVCSPRFPFKKMPKRFEDLLPYPLLVREKGSGTREVLEKFLQSKNYRVTDFASCLEIGSIHVLKALLLQEVGVAFLYRAAVQQELKKGLLQVLPLENVHLRHEFAFVWRKGSIFSQDYFSFFQQLQTLTLPAAQGQTRWEPFLSEPEVKN